MARIKVRITPEVVYKSINGEVRTLNRNANPVQTEALQDLQNANALLQAEFDNAWLKQQIAKLAKGRKV